MNYKFEKYNYFDERDKLHKSTSIILIENGYYIEYKGKKYYNGGKIKIPYARHMFETFEMKTVPSNALVNFSIHEPGESQIERIYDSSTSKTTIPIEDIKIAQ